MRENSRKNIVQKHNKAYLGLGSNIGDSRTILLRVLKELDKLAVRIIHCSSLYFSRPLRTAPNVDPGQDYLNIVIKINTYLLPEELLKVILKIEEQSGRIRKIDEKWGPRIIDIDIITYESLFIDTPILTIPHPFYQKRDFVLLPLKDISPDFICPKTKKDIDQLIKELKEEERLVYQKTPLPIKKSGVKPF